LILSQPLFFLHLPLPYLRRQEPYVKRDFAGIMLGAFTVLGL